MYVPLLFVHCCGINWFSHDKAYIILFNINLIITASILEHLNKNMVAGTAIIRNTMQAPKMHISLQICEL